MRTHTIILLHLAFLAKTSEQVPGTDSSKINYLGCYVDSWDRLMEARLPDSAYNTNEVCSDACWKRGYRYSGTQISHECFCANRLGRFPRHARHHRRPDSDCNHQCSGNRTEKCGGSWRLSAFERANIPDFKHLGCFVDYTTRLFYERLSYDEENSNDKCIYRCYQEGYKVAGTEYGYECFCGDADYFKDHTAEEVNDAECNTTCAGDSKQKCGGIWRQSVTVINPHTV